MLIPANSKLEYLLGSGGISLVRVGSDAQGFPTLSSEFFDLKSQTSFTALSRYSERTDFEKCINVDDSIIVVNSNGAVFFKYNGVIN